MSFFNRFSLFLMSISAVLFSGCGLLAFDITQELDEVVIPGMNPAYQQFNSSIIFPATPININLGAEIAAQGTGPATSAAIKELTLYVTSKAKASPTDEDYFDFFKTINLYIEGTGPKAIPRQKLAWIKAVPDKAETLHFEINDSLDLLPYIQDGCRIVSDVAPLMLPKDPISYKGTIIITIRV